MSKQIYMSYPNGLKKALTLSYDDGVYQDIRMIEILNRHGLKCTFNLNSGCYAPEEAAADPARKSGRLTEREVTELYTNSGHEVALHTLLHPHLETMTPAAITYEVLQDKVNLERQFGRIVRGMAYPFGTYNDTVVDCLRACGVAYARTTVYTDRFELPTDWLRMPATCHHSRPHLMELAQSFLDREVRDNAKLFYLWGHTYEFDNNQNWNVIEDFAALMGGRSDIWYATNIEIYDYVKAYESLQWSADGSIVHNPTATDVWFRIGNETYTVAAGETKTL